MLKITFGDNEICEKRCNTLTKTHFTKEVQEYAKTNNKNWKSKDISRVVCKIFEEEQSTRFLKKIDDGSRQLDLFNGQSEFVFENIETQNLFFLHGAFHIYKDGKDYKKITQETDKALYDKLEDVLNKEGQDVVCVFQHTDKINVIKNNGYLLNCLNKLENISGNLVIIGSSLDDNDNHIFENINNSKIDMVYISTFKNKDNIYTKAKSVFSKKNFCLFDAETISYEMPGTINEK